MEPKINEGAASDTEATNQDRVTATISHPLLNKWLTAEVINNLPDETPQAVADLIEEAVKRQKFGVGGIYYYECYGGTGKTISFDIELIREALLREGGVDCDEQKQPEHQ